MTQASALPPPLQPLVTGERSHPTGLLRPGLGPIQAGAPPQGPPPRCARSPIGPATPIGRAGASRTHEGAGRQGSAAPEASTTRVGPPPPSAVRGPSGLMQPATPPCAPPPPWHCRHPPTPCLLSPGPPACCCWRCACWRPHLPGHRRTWWRPRPRRPRRCLGCPHCQRTPPPPLPVPGWRWTRGSKPSKPSVLPPLWAAIRSAIMRTPSTSLWTITAPPPSMLHAQISVSMPARACGGSCSCRTVPRTPPRSPPDRCALPRPFRSLRPTGREQVQRLQ